MTPRSPKKTMRSEGRNRREADDGIKSNGGVELVSLSNPTRNSYCQTKP